MDLADRTVVVTGATDGIGRAVAERLAPRVGRLILHGPEPASDVTALLASLGPSVAYLSADFGELAAVARLGAEIRDAAPRVDVLVNNAGRPGSARRVVTADGNEATLQVNYLSTVALTTLLADRVGRVLNIASATHLSARLTLDDLDLAGGDYSPVTAYARSKLAIVTYSRWLAGRTPSLSPSFEVASMHPGVISTRLLAGMFTITGDPPALGAANVVHVAGLSGSVNGVYFDERRPADPNPLADDPRTQAALVERTRTRLAAVGVDPDLT